MNVQISETVCVICGDDYGDIAQECFVANTCPDCRDCDSLEELLEKALDAENADQGGE